MFEIEKSQEGLGQMAVPHQPTLTEQLSDKKSRLEAELVTTNEALDALKANPEIERVLNLVQKAARGY